MKEIMNNSKFTWEWAGGFFDGEGNVYISPLASPRVQIVQKEYYILEGLRELFQIDRKISPMTTNNHLRYILPIGSREDILRVCKNLIPFCVLKREILEQLVSILEVENKRERRKLLLQMRINQPRFSVS